jgi:hypothetical protein
MRLPLQRHPDTPCAAAAHIVVDVESLRGGRLKLSYVVTGIIGDLRLPSLTASTRTDGLWRHTCFEAFIRPLPGEAYYEFNLAPSTQWAAYRFDSYRSGMRVAAEFTAPRIEVQTDPARYTLQAVLTLDELPDLPPDGRWRLALSAVIEETNGGKSYWALAHPPSKPDFHHADGFAYELP